MDKAYKRWCIFLKWGTIVPYFARAMMSIPLKPHKYWISSTNRWWHFCRHSWKVIQRCLFLAQEEQSSAQEEHSSARRNSSLQKRTVPCTTGTVLCIKAVDGTIKRLDLQRAKFSLYHGPDFGSCGFWT